MRIITMLVFTMILTRGDLFAQLEVFQTPLKTLEGKTTRISDFLGQKPTILSFWATWCLPCKKELDAITEIYPYWQESFGVQLIAVSIDNARAIPRIKPMISEKEWPFIIMTDSNQALMRALNFQTIPQTFLINPEGLIVYRHSGYLPGDELELESHLERISP